MSGAHPPINPNFKNLQDVTATVFITNFPTSLGSKDLWQHCDKHGTVADVYIARKLSKIGRRFAFVRFLKVKNKESLIIDLNKIWIGSYHLFAAMARFDKKPNTTSKTIPKPSTNQPNNQTKPSSSSAHTNPNRSYVNALNRNSSHNFALHPKTILKSVTLDESDLIDTSDIRNVILAKVRDVHLIPNINIVLNKEGFYNFQCKYIGGMWLWIEFDSHEACLKLQSNKEMSWYFTLLKHIHHSFVLDERVVWIEIGGLPLNAWTPKAFKKIAINENCKVVILGKSHNVSVKEFAGWAPDIKAMEPLSGSNSEMDNSDKHEDDLSDNGSPDKEEGKIPNSNVNEEEEYVKNTQWAEGVENADKNQEGFFTEHQHPPIEKTEVLKEDSNSISKPPGFEGYKSNNNLFSTGGNRQSSKQPSYFSSAPVKSTRVSKSQSKSLNNHGSMIEAFVSHIEMGKVLGYDMEGSKNDLKKYIDSLGAKQVSFLGIQETHSTKLDPFKVKSTWGNFQFDFVECPSNGRSGGLVSIWDPNVFSKINEFQFENFLIVEGNWIASHTHCFMINVYAPQEDRKKETIWNKILEFMNINQGHYIIFGDFNVVRYASERIGTIFNPSSANVFNQFIRDAHLWDIPLGGHLFTRINKHGDKLSKLDRFLTSDSFAPLLQKYSAHVLDCQISDHRPILLTPLSVDFGLTPLNFFNSWLLDKNLQTTITEFWDNFSPENFDEAAELARRSIYHATFRDGASGGVASVYHVGPNGWTKLSGDDVGELHYSYYPVEPATVEHEMTEAVVA
ncbi:RNA-directed DNA polymerase, eukaryota [Tanacetum coccineum]